jgi:subtilase family serine protease
VKVESMHFLKHRSWPGILTAGTLASICLLAGSFCPISLAGNNGQAFAASPPDLSIQSVTWSPGQPSIGDRVYFSVIVANNGGEPAGNFSLLFYIDNDMIDSACISQVVEGFTASYIFAWKAVPGAHIVKIVADANNSVVESVETNNERSCAFSVLAPDLVIETITWSPEKTSVGDPVTFTLTIKNIGNKTAGAYWVDLLIDNATRGQCEMPSLDPGEVSVIDYVWITQPGQHTLEARVDVLNQVAENNEDNNNFNAFYCTTPPDLTVDSLTWSPETRNETDQVTMSIEVINRGEGASFGTYLTYSIDDIIEKSDYVHELEPGESVVFTYLWTPGADARTFKAIIDTENSVFESDESNNERSITLPPLGLPELSIESVVWSPQNPAPNTLVTFTVTIANTGFRAVDSCDVALYINRELKISRQPGPIPAGSTAQETMQYLTTDSVVNIRAVIDERNIIQELDESNNEELFSFTPVRPNPVADLTVESITCTRASLGNSQYMNISVIIKNQGTGSCPPSRATCYIDNEITSDIFFSAIDPGTSMERTLRWKTVMGNHTIKIIIDPEDAIYETNENNNEATAPLVTSDPDLAVENIEWFPTYPEIGNDVSFTTTIKNQGNRASGACFLTYYIDGVKRGEHYLDAIEPGASTSRIFKTDMQAASHTFLVVIDEVNAVTESDETNNTRSVVIPAPDLIVKNITSSGDYPVADAVMSFTIDIANTGRSAAGVTSTAGYIDGEPLALVETGVIDAGGTSQSVFFWTAQPGKHTLRIITDEGNTVTESDETNNAKEVIIFVPMPVTTTVVTEPASENITASADPIAPLSDPAVTPDSSNNSPAIEEIFRYLENSDSTDNVTEDISGNISAADVPKSGITGILTNKWLLIGVAGVGIFTITVLLLMRKRSSQPKKEKPPKPAPQAKPAKPAKAPLPKPAAAKQGPVAPGATLSGKPAVLVPPPPKPGTAPVVPPKAIVPPDARQGLGATLVKQGNPPAGTTPSPPPPK